MNWQSTHRIVFTPSDGSRLDHWTVMLCKDPYSQEYLLGVNESDWRNERVPTWRYRKSDGTWWWMGFPRPNWKVGAIAVMRLGEQDHDPATLQYGKRRAPAALIA